MDKWKSVHIQMNRIPKYLKRRLQIKITIAGYLCTTFKLYITYVVGDTVNFGFKDIGFSDKSLITTHFFSPEISSSILYTPDFGYNEVLDNDTLYITTLFLYLMCANHIGYCDFGAFCDTALKFLRTIPSSEKQCQSVRELQDFLADHQLGRLQQPSITRFF